MSQYKSPELTSRILLGLELEILKQGNKLNSEDACSFHNRLVTCYHEFLESYIVSVDGYSCDIYNKFKHPHQKIACADFLWKKAFQLEQKLLQFFTPEYTISSIPFDFKVNNEHAATSTLPALFRKQKFYIEMINSLEPTNDLNPEQTKVQSKHLDQFHKEFISNQSEITSIIEDASFAEQVEISQKVEQKVRKIQTQLERVISPIDTSTPIPASTSLLQKQKYYIKMIDALESSDNLNQKEAEVQSEQLSQYEEKFVVNQSELIALIGNASFDDQVEISQKVQQKVRKIQAKLKEISAMKTLPSMPPASSLVNEHFNKTERPRVIVDFLDSLRKKQISLIEQIELIESKNDLGATEAETLHTHLSQLHDAFVKNQSKIETYVSGPALDEQLQINGDVLQKVMTLQTKLKDIFALVKPPSENVSTDGAQLKLSDSVHYVNWLFDKLTGLEKDMKEIIVYGKYMPSSVLPSVEEYWTWFVSYESELKQLVAESPYDLKKIRDISCNAYGHVTRCRSKVEQQLEREKNHV